MRDAACPLSTRGGGDLDEQAVAAADGPARRRDGTHLRRVVREERGARRRGCVLPVDAHSHALARAGARRSRARDARPRDPRGIDALDAPDVDLQVPRARPEVLALDLNRRAAPREAIGGGGGGVGDGRREEGRGRGCRISQEQVDTPRPSPRTNRTRRVPLAGASEYRNERPTLRRAMAGRDGRDLGPRVLELLLRRDARRGRARAGRPGRAERALPADADGDGAVALARRHHLQEGRGVSD